MCQIKLATAQQYEPKMTRERLLSPRVNARIAAKILEDQLDRYNNDIPCAVAAYNAGSCRFNKYGGIKNRKYVAKVFRNWVDGK
jgi:soluble lytic murein transglycosylase-like protein